MTFSDYMRRRRVTDTPAGDFVVDFKNDEKGHARDFKTWEELDAYLFHRNACHEAHRVGRLWWRRFQTHRAAVS